ncbi:MAG: hypothetical protein EOO05_15520 [Chitinophagaceae bacterium]|nr:MAG: hypothetical protein EOO05_15520 [Chitinophagaceae bacterium]
MTLLCLMELFSVSCESMELALPNVSPDTASETVYQTSVAIGTNSAANEISTARVDLYPSPLQFAN